MLLSVGRQFVPALRDRYAMADCSHRVLDGFVRPDVHADVAGRDDWHSEFLRYSADQIPMFFVFSAMMQGESDARTAWRTLNQPGGLAFDLLVFCIVFWRKNELTIREATKVDQVTD